MKMNNDFFQSLDFPLTWKKIILIDFNNQHGLDMYSLLSNASLFPSLPFFRKEWQKITEKENLFSILQNNYNKQNNIYCIPLCWNTTEYNVLLQNIAKNNIVIAPYDEENKYPWSLPGVYCANKNNTWYYSDNNFQERNISGYSVDTIILSIIALKGEDFLKNFMKERS